MSREFVSKYMWVAAEITRAQRALSVDPKLQLIDVINLEQKMLDDDQFKALAIQCLKEAIADKAPIITNNIITDPAQAPVTNTNFSDLRVIVAFPVGEMGAIYLDQHIRHGIIPKEIIEKLMTFASQCIEMGQTNKSVDDLLQEYQHA